MSCLYEWLCATAVVTDYKTERPPRRADCNPVFPTSIVKTLENYCVMLLSGRLYTHSAFNNP